MKGSAMQYGKFAALYDGFMSDVDYGMWSRYLSALIERTAAEAALIKPKTLLECGCGTGSLTIPLKKAGFSITATDASDEMLAIASEKARSAAQLITFVRMDMRRIALHRPVDCVIAGCDCVNYLTADDDALAFFKSAYAALKKGGLLLFDVSSEYKLKTVLGTNSFTDSRSDMAYFWRNNYDEASRLIEMDLEFFVKSERAPQLYERFTERHIQRAYGEGELSGLLLKAGFASARAYGAFTFKPPAEDAQRLQFVAVK